MYAHSIEAIFCLFIQSGCPQGRTKTSKVEFCLDQHHLQRCVGGTGMEEMNID